MFQAPSKMGKICNISLILMVIAAIVLFFAGFAVIGVKTSVKAMTKYMENAASIQPNYEKNIVLYTSKTEKVIAVLLKIRPERQEEYVGFISKVEELAQNRSLNLDVKAIDGVIHGKDDNQISYNISFYGTDKDLLSLLEEFDDLPYYINVSSISFDNVDSLSDSQKETFNIHLKIDLHVKA